MSQVFALRFKMLQLVQGVELSPDGVFTAAQTHPYPQPAYYITPAPPVITR